MNNRRTSHIAQKAGETITSSSTFPSLVFLIFPVVGSNFGTFLPSTDNFSYIITLSKNPAVSAIIFSLEES